MEQAAISAGNGLLNTTDANIWAEEFCRIFDGHAVVGEETLQSVEHKDWQKLDVGLMTTWFASAIETGRVAGRNSGLTGLPETQVHSGTWFGFLHFYYIDHSNAAIHCGAVRYSPITFRLAEFLLHLYPTAPHPDQGEYVLLHDDYRLKDVLEHLGRYEEDRGR